MHLVLRHLIIGLYVIVIISCKRDTTKYDPDFSIAFGSCNMQNAQNNLWDDIIAQNPKVWIWGGDNIYADTEDMEKLNAEYHILLQDEGYKALKNKTKILGTWDDHDYGINDGGEHFTAKKESQQVFLDFFDVPKNDDRRKQEGVYYAETIKAENGSIKIIILDTRYFRSDLTISEDNTRRFQPNKYGEGTILGPEQWQWLEQELMTSQADFNIIMSSIQFLSNQHGFETWGNFPHEVDRLKQLILNSKAKRVIILSGDRHISEFSKDTIPGLAYPLIDFTSSGLTHVYSSFTSEPNPYRFGKVVPKISFGLLEFNFKSKEVTMKMIGDGNVIQQQFIQQY
jgi:alkaline phosphatase D